MLTLACQARFLVRSGAVSPRVTVTTKVRGVGLRFVGRNCHSLSTLFTCTDDGPLDSETAQNLQVNKTSPNLELPRPAKDGLTDRQSRCGSRRSTLSLGPTEGEVQEGRIWGGVEGLRLAVGGYDRATTG